jgi:hypothetical protein
MNARDYIKNTLAWNRLFRSVGLPVFAPVLSVSALDRSRESLP